MPGSRTSPSSRSHLCWAHSSLTAITPGLGASSRPWEGSRSLPRAEQAVLDACWALKGCSTASCSPQHSRTAPPDGSFRASPHFALHRHRPRGTRNGRQSFHSRLESALLECGEKSFFPSVNGAGGRRRTSCAPQGHGNTSG